MKVVDIHEREFDAPPAAVGALLDSLSSREDRLWPIHCWPRMTFDRALGVGASGGHGPIRYRVEAYFPGESIRFRFSGPRGFDGGHGFELIHASGAKTGLRHTLEMKVHGIARLSWPLVFRPLHQALIEDSLATAEASLGLSPRLEPWSGWVRLLRWAMSAGRAPIQNVPRQAQRTTTTAGTRRAGVAPGL
jgi:hypothetical protein